MITRKSTRLTEKSPIIPTTELSEDFSNMTIDDSKKMTRIARTTPGTEYVSDIRISDCESDSDGLKGKVFAEFVYNQLKHVEEPDYTTMIPKIYIMMGPPGAGKSTIKRQFNIKNYVNIDLDEIKKLLQKCFPDDRSIKGFGIINQLKRLAKYLLDTAIRENINILFDTTGRMKELVTEVIEKTVQSEYTLYFIIVSTSRENCLQRAELRNISERDREPMTPEMVNGAYDSFMENSATKGTLSYYLLANPNLTSEANEIYIFDNNGPSPQLVFKRVGENIETVVDYPDLYNMKINTTPPYFSLKTTGGRRLKRTIKRKKYGKKKTRRHK